VLKPRFVGEAVKDADSSSQESADIHECPACNRPFDSRQGLGQHHSAKHGEKLREIIICAWCDSERRVKPHEVDSARFCNRECKAAWQSEHTAGENNPNWEKTPMRTCATDYCVQEFPIYPSTEDQEHCSADCRNWGPWQNKDLLTYLHDTCEMHQQEIANQFGCYQTTVGRSLRRHEIETREQKGAAADPRLESKEWLKTTYVDRGMTSGQIGDWVGVSHSIVWEWCQRHGIETNWPWAVKKLRDEGWLVEQYVDGRRSTLDIADELDCGAQAVANWLNRYGVELRSPHEAGPDHPLHDPTTLSDYGPGWNEAKKEQIRERDNRECQHCGRSEAEHLDLIGMRQSVHHIQKARSFDDSRIRNHPDNLVTLCQIPPKGGEKSCHKVWERYSPLRPDIAD
jgi:hypothetical protein